MAHWLQMSGQLLRVSRLMLLLRYPKEGQSMTKVIIVAALWLVISTTTGTATTTDIEGRTLYTMCAPMMFVVEELPLEDIQKTGLTHKAITNAVESRLRGSRLFAPFEKLELERQQYLYINVHNNESRIFYPRSTKSIHRGSWLWTAGSRHCLGRGVDWYARWRWAIYHRRYIPTLGRIHSQLSAGE